MQNIGNPNILLLLDSGVQNTMAAKFWTPLDSLLLLERGYKDNGHYLRLLYIIKVQFYRSLLICPFDMVCTYIIRHHNFPVEKAISILFPKAQSHIIFKDVGYIWFLCFQILFNIAS